MRKLTKINCNRREICIMKPRTIFMTTDDEGNNNNDNNKGGNDEG